MSTKKLVCLVFLLITFVSLGQSNPKDGLTQSPDMVKFSGRILEIPAEAFVCNGSEKTIKVQIQEVLYKGRTVNFNLQPQAIITILIDPKVSKEKKNKLQADQVLMFHAMKKLCPEETEPILTALSWASE